jgi:hypothetical protein
MIDSFGGVALATPFLFNDPRSPPGQALLYLRERQKRVLSVKYLVVKLVYS